MSGALLLPMWDCTQSLPMSLEDKTVRAWLSKVDKQACGWLGTKSSPTIVIVFIYMEKENKLIKYLMNILELENENQIETYSLVL